MKVWRNLFPFVLQFWDKNHFVRLTFYRSPWNHSGNTKGWKYHSTVDLLFDWFGISCMTTDNFCFYLQNRLIQTSQTGGQWYSDTSPFSIPCIILRGDTVVTFIQFVQKKFIQQKKNKPIFNMDKIFPGVWYLTWNKLKVAWTKFSTVS